MTDINVCVIHRKKWEKAINTTYTRSYPHYPQFFCPLTTVFQGKIGTGVLLNFDKRGGGNRMKQMCRSDC